MAVSQEERRTRRAPLDGKTLEEAALRYAGRYATTRSKLATFLRRKLRERGWAGDGDPPVEPLVARMAELGYVDDRAFASARAASLGRRGYGERRVSQALRAAGIDEEDGEEARAQSRRDAHDAALRFAQRRRIGPFAAEPADLAGRQKALAALLRAGHPIGLARRLADARPGEIPEPDSD